MTAGASETFSGFRDGPRIRRQAVVCWRYAVLSWLESFYIKTEAWVSIKNQLLVGSQQCPFLLLLKGEIWGDAGQSDSTGWESFKCHGDWPPLTIVQLDGGVSWVVLDSPICFSHCFWILEYYYPAGVLQLEIALLTKKLGLFCDLEKL